MYEPLCQNILRRKLADVPFNPAKIQQKSNPGLWQPIYELFLCELLTLFQNLLTTPFSFSIGPQPSGPPNGPRISNLSSGSPNERGSSRSGLLDVCHPYSVLSSARRSGLVSVILSVISRLPAIACVYDSGCFTKVGFVTPRCVKSPDVLLIFDPKVGDTRFCGRKGGSAGVSGDSGSTIEISSSNKEVLSSLRNDFSVAYDLLGAGISFDNSLGGLFSLSLPSVTPSIDGNPNSIASSNFWGEAR